MSPGVTSTAETCIQADTVGNGKSCPPCEVWEGFSEAVALEFGFQGTNENM